MLPPREPLFDQHTIQTPEQVTLNLPIAGIGSRFLAIALDTLIQAGIVIALLLTVVVLRVTGLFTGFQFISVWVMAVFGFCIFLLMYGYFAIFEILWNGQTPGKRVVGIRVVKDSGRPLTAAESIGRNLMRVVDQLPFFYVVGVIVAMSNSQHRRLGDFIAGSMMIREKAPGEITPLWHDASNQPSVPPSAAAGALSMGDLALIDAFLGRRSHLAVDVRVRAAAQILAKVGSGIERPVDSAGHPLSDEAFLERLAYERRLSA